MLGAEGWILGESQALGDEMVVHDGEGTIREKIGGEVQVAGIASALGKSRLGETMNRYVSKGSGKNRVFFRSEG